MQHHDCGKTNIIQINPRISILLTYTLIQKSLMQ